MKLAFVVSDSEHRISFVNFEVTGCSRASFDEEVVWEALCQKHPKLLGVDKVGVMDHTPQVGYHWYLPLPELAEKLSSGELGGLTRIHMKTVQRTVLEGVKE